LTFCTMGKNRYFAQIYVNCLLVILHRYHQKYLDITIVWIMMRKVIIYNIIYNIMYT